MSNPDSPLPPLHDQNPLGRFSNRAEDYAKYRPIYPPEAIATLLSGLGSESDLGTVTGTFNHLIAADVGAGTGISSRLLADQGVTVWAIEPNAAMRAAATPHPRVEFREGTAEQTGLPHQSVHIVLCCQAFHWFNQPIALQEFHRILKPGGRVAILWNDRHRDDPLTAQYSEMVLNASDRDILDRGDRKSAAAIAVSPLFTHFRQHTINWTRQLDLPSLLGMVRSSSYVPKTGAVLDQLLIDLTELHRQHAVSIDGTRCISLAHQTNVYLAETNE